MCSAYLEQIGALTVEVNAWQQGHTNRPLIDLVAALSTRLEGHAAWDKVKRAASQMGWRAAGVLTRELVAPLDTDNPAVFQAWTDIEGGVERFKLSLRDQVRGLDCKLVILVDELERCEPIYALDLLNKARHLFDVAGAAITFGGTVRNSNMPCRRSTESHAANPESSNGRSRLRCVGGNAATSFSVKTKLPRLRIRRS